MIFRPLSPENEASKEAILTPKRTTVFPRSPRVRLPRTRAQSLHQTSHLTREAVFPWLSWQAAVTLVEEVVKERPHFLVESSKRRLSPEATAHHLVVRVSLSVMWCLVITAKAQWAASFLIQPAVTAAHFWAMSNHRHVLDSLNHAMSRRREIACGVEWYPQISLTINWIILGKQPALCITVLKEPGNHYGMEIVKKSGYQSEKDIIGNKIMINEHKDNLHLMNNNTERALFYGCTYLSC